MSHTASPIDFSNPAEPRLDEIAAYLRRYNPRGRWASTKGARSMDNDVAAGPTTDRPEIKQPTPMTFSRTGEDSQNYGGRRATDKKWFDPTLNLPTLLTLLAMVTACIGTGFTVYSSLDKRIMALEASDRQQELHFTRIELAQSDSRQEIRSSLDKLTDKVDGLSNQLSALSAGNRPGIQQWTK